MYSVTQRIRKIHQPYGGYLPIRAFHTTALNDGQFLFPDENIHGSLVGLSVDYLTRFMDGTPVNEAFKISLMGADTLDAIKNRQKKKNAVKESHKARELLSKITSLDDDSIFYACQLVGYDVCFRAGTTYYQPVDGIEPDKATIHNIRVMVQRSLSFLAHYGPVVKDGFTFEGGYTRTVSSGDGDFITADTMWDFKVLKSKPSSRDTLQLLMYYLMGLHSIHPQLHKIQNIGFFNPRFNTVYLLNVSEIPEEVISEVEEEVIGYAPPVKENPNPTLVRESAKNNCKPTNPAVDPPKKIYPVGAEINHPKFGTGTVAEIRSMGPLHLTIIKFSDKSRTMSTSILNRILRDS